MASSTPPDSVPPGQSSPLYTITPTDQAGTIVIVTAVCLITAVVSILVRAYVMVQSGTWKLRWDDWAVGVALLLAVVQTSIVQHEAAIGLGRTIRDLTNHQVQQIQPLQYADELFYILSVWVSKLSATLFFYRLSPRANDRKMSRGAILMVGITGIAAMFSVCFVCDLRHPWRYFDSESVTCTAPYNRWIGVAVLDILSELVLACLATKVLWPLQMPISKKLTAGFVFFQRLAIIAPIIVRLHFLFKVYHGDDPTLRATYSTICKETQVAFAIVATNIPCFRSFFIATATHYGAPADGAKSPYGFSTGAGESINLTDMNTAGGTQSSTQQSSTQHSRASRRLDFSPVDRNRSVAAVISDTGERCDTRRSRSDGSREMIIRKDVNYDVQYYDGKTSHDIRGESP